MLKLVAAALLVGLAVALPWKPKADVCGYNSCPQADPKKLNVHLVPHSHDDVGWLKTVDQYYYGSKNNIQGAGVQYILDSVVSELLKNPARKFIQVESAFFFKWWDEQSPETQEAVKTLVNRGQLEFIGGAWSMNDEATTHYQTTIDNFSWGLRRLNDTFGQCAAPRVGWQIDPFGHSREQASLMAQYNFDGLFFARIDYQDRQQRLKTKTMEMIWQGDDNLGKQADLFTGYLYGFYGNPGGFCFDIYCDDEPIIDNPDIPDYNVPRRVEEFVKLLNEQKQYFATNNIVLTMGGDFQYQDAAINFKNMDKLIKATNELYPDINAFYSTPSCYVKALNEANNTWTTKSDDFFPYGSGQNTYWTGYFTSRPTLKRFERLANNILQAGKQLASVAAVDQATASKLDAHREAQGILQHHDAVAGTEKQAVAEDYARLLQIGVANSEDVIATSINKFVRKNPADAALSLATCPQLNISQCAVTESSDAFLITLYNPLSRSVNRFVRFPAADGNYKVTDPDGNDVPTQAFDIPEPLTKLPGREAKTTREITFQATDLPALGYKVYYVAKSASKAANHHETKVWKPTGVMEDIYVGNERYGVTLDGKTKLVKSVTSNRATFPTTPSMEYYVGVIGDNGAEERRSSGAYAFRPTTTNSIPIADGSNVTIQHGDLGFEVHQTFSPWASQIIRHFYRPDGVVDNVLEVEWLVGPIPVEDGDGKEVILKYKTYLNTDGEVRTDTSGRNNLRRKRDFRPTWDLEVHEPVSGNYYPVVLDISIDNGTDRLAVVTDRAQGGGSINDGEVEVMVHRRLLHDDAFGVGEPLNEEAFGTGLVARGIHYIVLGSTADEASDRVVRLVEQQRVMDVVSLFTDVSGKSFADIKNSLNLQFSSLTRNLPDEVQILTLEPWKDGSLLLRLENVLTADQQEGSSVTVDLSTLFSTFTVTGARETTLAGNQWLNEATRLQWKKQGSSELTPGQWPNTPVDIKSVSLTPKQIRTFVINVKNP